MTGYTNMAVLANGDLRFTLTDEGREELAYQVVEYETKGDEAIFLDMIEDHLNDEWRLVEPEEVGALTSSLLLTNAGVDDDGDLESDAEIWWFPNYQVASYCDELAQPDGITFSKGEN